MYATCFATYNEIIFNARRVVKNDSSILIMSYCDWFLLKKLRDKLQWGVLNTPCMLTEAVTSAVTGADFIHYSFDYTHHGKNYQSARS